jgi:hypothetical protein
MLQYQEDNELPVGERSWLHAHLTTGDVLLVVATPQMMDAACASGTTVHCLWTLPMALSSMALVQCLSWTR